MKKGSFWKNYGYLFLLLTGIIGLKATSRH